MNADATIGHSDSGRSVYLVEGRRVQSGAPGFVQAVAAAHAARLRPRCLCTGDDPGGGSAGVEMYIARLGDGYLVKRMPDTGCLHAPDCPSYEPPAGCSGLGQVLDSAIIEDPATGETTLKLGFSMTRVAGRSTLPSASVAGGSVATDGTKLSLRALLHYLWDQAELTRWQPGFAGRRSWATVRRHLLQAAEHKVAKVGDLHSRLYVPEVFAVEQREAINARRLTQWLRAAAQPGKAQHLMLVVGEVKEIVPSRYGYKAVIKHVPDQAFALDEQLYRRMGRRFEAELSLWGAADDLHLVVAATFGVSTAGVPVVGEMTLMAVTQQWLPVEDGFEQQLVERLVHDGRTFVKQLRYDLPADGVSASAVLLDGEGEPMPLYLAGCEENFPPAPDVQRMERASGPATRWLWHSMEEAMPALPQQRAAVIEAVPPPTALFAPSRQPCRPG